MNSKIVLLAAGECAYLTNPIDVKEFLKMVAEKRG
jgi:DNA-binding response OmpR family regulator